MNRKQLTLLIVVAAVLVITTTASGFNFYNLSVLLAAFTDTGGNATSVATRSDIYRITLQAIGVPARWSACSTTASA